mmetsp:Transcript_21576/g.46461  ORF Transcript_21576/g.46461 Transcript_21576/m.46461 type:complete len:331 (-) Transcript_21576:185-1177(-)
MRWTTVVAVMICSCTSAIRIDSACSRRVASAAALACALRPALPAAAIRDRTEPQQELELLDSYRAQPVDVRNVKLPRSFHGQRDVVLILHGRGGEDRETEDTRVAVLAQDRANNVTRAVEVYNWEQWIDPSPNRLFLAATDVGTKLGQALASESQLRSVHLIGTSAGGFVADACCKAYVTERRARPKAKIWLSLCDPFTNPNPRFGTLDWFLGSDASTLAAGKVAANFGIGADFAEHFLNTDDIVPSTSTPLPNCYVYDVTSSTEKRAFPLPGGGETTDKAKNFILWSLGYHNFPMAYFAVHYRTVRDDEGRVRFPSHDELPRGTVVRVA